MSTADEHAGFNAAESRDATLQCSKCALPGNGEFILTKRLPGSKAILALIRNRHIWKENAMKGITGFGHAAIKVKDLDASLAFYKDKLGFPEMLRLHNKDGSTWLVYLRITEEVFLEIFPGAENDRAPGWNANGVNHMCLTIDNLDTFCPAIEAKGIKLTAQIKDGLDGNRQAWIEDPDGNRIELMEMHADCLQYKGLKRLREEGRVPA
jgi:catechol 2,3-dioxygenase-like lactoylglutathione lyase family enzyme